MKARNILAAVVQGLKAAVGPVQTDFVLMWTEHLDVATEYTKGVLRDASTVDVLAGGHISTASLWDKTILSVRAIDSSVAVDIARVFNAARIAVFSGRVGELRACDTSTVAVSGGSVIELRAHITSSVAVSGGTIAELRLTQNSTVNVSGGSIGMLYASPASSVAVSGGTISVLLTDGGTVAVSGGMVDELCAGSGTVDISGGSVGKLCAHGTMVALHGCDFQARGGLSLAGDKVIGTGLLSGKWFDGTPWTVNISENTSGATILAIP